MKERAYDISTVLECIKNKTVVTGLLKVSQGKNIMAVSIPVLDSDQNVVATITNSLDHAIVSNYMAALDREKKKVKNYKETIRFLSSNELTSNPIIAESSAMKNVLKIAENIAPTDCTVLILGESGTGKDVVANYIHRRSTRASEQFIPINCATIPKDLLESELFGYERGAFTGANDKGKMGLFEMAHKGTLFLDEIGELSLDIQAKFLRVLETGNVRRLGSTNSKKYDFRLIAATNRNLLDMVKSGTFREDLYYRLNVVPLSLPPLSKRPEDIVALINMFLQKFNQKYGRHKKIHKNELRYFEQYDWPGNIRELQNIIERLVITDTDVSSLFFRQFENETLENALPPKGKQSLKEYMDAVEQEYIQQVIHECHGNMSEAARRLKIHRTSLYKK